MPTDHGVDAESALHWEIASGLIGALGLFLLGVSWLSERLERLGMPRVRPWLDWGAARPVVGLLVGMVVTVALDSSSAVIVLLIALVQAGALPVRGALALTLGANVGTAVGSEVLAMDLDTFGPVALGVGAVFRLIRHGKSGEELAELLVGLGLVFTGMGRMEEVTAPLRDHPAALEAFASLSSPLRGALVGGLVTLVLQSSSVTVGMAIGLAKAGILPLQSGVAVMLGAEIGTCADTLVASLGRRRAALRVGLFHLGFNLVSVVVDLSLLSSLTALAEWISPQGGPARQLAHAHLLFNTLGALAVLPHIRTLDDLLTRLLPEPA
jgi:phosphate:Na+ symporter